MLKVVETKLPKDMFGAEVNLTLIAQANHVAQNRAHIGLRNTKTRSEVNRTTKKVYKQKGTGGARHGSRRANVFVGGGIVFGPRPVKRVLTMSRAAKKLALAAAFSAKAKDKEVVVVGGTDKIAKTKEVSEFVKKLNGKKFTFFLSEKSKSALKFIKNIANVRAVNYKSANVLDVLNGGLLLIDEAVLETPKAEKKEVAVKKVETKKVPAKKEVKAKK